MNKKLIAVAVSAAFVLPVSASAAEVTGDKLHVYGKLHMNYGSYETLASDNWQLSSFASRLGIKGKQKLMDSLSGTYKFEWQVDYETGADAGLSRRNMYAGLKGGFGEVRIGRHDSPLKMAQDKFDQFGDTNGDLKNAGDEDGENRHDDTITYLGKFGNVGLDVQLIPGEGDGVAAGDGPADTISVAVKYKAGPLYLAFAQDSYDSTAGAAEDSLTRFIATYKMGSMQFGALVQSGVEAPDSAAAAEDWLGLSFNMKLGGGKKFKAQYIVVEDSATPSLESTQMTIGLDQKLGKKGKLYAMYNTLEETAGGVTSKDNSSFSVGYVLKF